MKFSCTQDNLKQGLNNVVHITGKNVNLPILSNVLIEIEDSNIKLISTDLELGITCNVRGKIEQPGKFTVNAKIFNDYINLLPTGKRIDMELLDNELKVQCENYKTKIKGEDPEDYPIIPQVEQTEYVSFNFEEFRKTINEVAFSAAQDETRIELSGVYCDFSGDKLVLAATDSYRLAEKKLKYKHKDEKITSKLIIPTKTLQEVIRLSQDEKKKELISENMDNELKIYITDSQILFTYREVELVSRIIEGQYPDYQQIIPNASDENKTIIKISKSELTRAIKASALFSKININDINLDFPQSQKKAIVSAVSGQSGESTIELSADITGKDNGIVLNYKYLLEGLNNLDTEEVILEIVDGSTPCLLKKENDQDYLYIIMPIKQ